MTDPVRLAVLGVSSIAVRSFIPAALASSTVELVAIGSRDPDRARDLGTALGVGFGSYDEVVARSDVEAAYVCVPTGLHAQVATQALLHDCHVLVEKPFATGVGEAERLLALADQRGLVAMENLMYLQHPHVRTLLAMVRSGRIGTVRHVEAAFGFPLRPAPDIRYSRALGGGATLDSLIYPASLACEIYGYGPRAQWSRVQDDPASGVDSRGTVTLDFGSGTATVVYGWDFAYRNDVRVWGSAGELTAQRVFSRPADLAGAVELTGADGSVSVPTEAADHFRLLLERFAAAVRQRSPEAEAQERQRMLDRLSVVEQAHTGYVREHPAP